jgi:hypothetical protein
MATSPHLTLLRSQDDWVAKFFSNRAVIIAANRGPVTFEKYQSDNLQCKFGEGGLVKALLGLCQHADVTWIACARTDADATWRAGRVATVDGSEVQVQFLLPGAPAYEGYYNAIANPLLWFLQHSMWDVPRSPVIDHATWRAWEEGYVAVNRLFAEAIARQVRTASRPTLVMLQDYHLYLAARFLRQSLRPKERPTTLHGKGVSWSGRGASAMAKVRELLINGELSQWCGRQAARGSFMQKPPVAVRATTRKKRDQGEWLQAGVPAPYGPSASNPWAKILRQMLHPHTY